MYKGFLLFAFVLISCLADSCFTGKYFVLGLGDFVFYGLLAARAALMNVPTLVTCTLALLMVCCSLLFLLLSFVAINLTTFVAQGLAATILITTRSPQFKALPALPISIALGIIFYFITPSIIVPYLEHISISGLFL
jgi:presenilin 1